MSVFSLLWAILASLSLLGTPLSAAAQNEDPTPASQLIEEARAELALGEPGAAEASYKAAIEVAQETEDNTALLIAWRELASCYISQVNLAQANDAASQAATVARLSGDTKETAQLFLRLGSVWRVVGRYSRAAAALEEAHALFSEAGDLEGEAGTLLSMGILADLMGELDAAAMYFGDACELYRQLGDDACVAQCFSDQAHAFERLGEADKAIAGFQQAIFIYQQLKQPLDEARARVDLGNVYMQVDDNQAASFEFLTALGLVDADVQILLAAEASWMAGKSLVRLEDLSRAGSYLEQAWDLYENEQAVETLQQLFVELNYIWVELDQPDKAAEYRSQLDALLE